MATFTGTVAADIFDGGAGADSFFMQQGGDDDVDGGGGSDGFYFGAALTGRDLVSGGLGSDGPDTLALQGNYRPPLGDPRWELPIPTLFGVREIEILLLLSGTDTRFGDLAGNSYDYDLVAIDSNVQNGATLSIIASDLKPGEDFRFDGSAETNGFFRIFAGQGDDVLIGGQRDDGFFFGDDNNLTTADRVNGNGGNDSVALRGNYSGANAVVIEAGQIQLVENFVLLSGLTTEFGGVVTPGGFDYDITLNGAGMTFNGSTLGLGETLRIDASAATDSDSRIFGSINADILIGRFDQIFSAGGDDQITVTSGFFRIEAGDGNDTIEIAALSPNTIDGGAGSDLLRIGSTPINLFDISFRNVINVETLELVGVGGNYTFGVEVLEGGIRTIRDVGSGANAIDASAMRDQAATLTFDLGAGADQLVVGGVGSNILLYDSLSDSSGSARDTITGFLTGLDKVDVRAIDTPVPLSAIEFKGNAAGLAAAQALLEAGDGNLDAVFDSQSNTLWFNLNDDAVLDANDLSIVLLGVTSLQGADVLDGALLI